MPASRINRSTALDKKNNLNKSYLTGFIFFWLPVFICMGMIFYFSSIPGEDIPSLFPFQDILFHLFIYTLLGFFFIRALKNTDLESSPFKLIHSRPANLALQGKVQTGRSVSTLSRPRTKARGMSNGLILFTVLFGVIYGISDEFHQSFVPNRNATGFDVFIDVIGSFLGGLLYQ